ncbi:hypothetical protein J6590_060635 [Homalodisca vitripennis]|nr:hypothetical protein J6590_060633 [Homalodisca vitripennis]KAG8247479.1 hypothetical protein J6590_060635 [Homalodisca vitripennis]
MGREGNIDISLMTADSNNLEWETDMGREGNIDISLMTADSNNLGKLNISSLTSA